MTAVQFVPFLLVICSCYNYFGDRYKSYKNNILYFISFALVIFLLGVRVKIGTDHQAYALGYYTHLRWYEFLYNYLNEILYLHKAPYQILFLSIAAIQFFFVFKSFEKLEISVFLGFIVFYCFNLCHYINILRQSLAMSILIFSYACFVKKEYFHCILLYVSAILFHSAAFIALFFVFFALLLTKIKLPNIFYYGAMFFLLIFADKLYDIIMGILSKIVSESIIFVFTSHQNARNSGLGVRFKILSSICTLPFFLSVSNSTKEFRFFFNLWFTGIFGQIFASTSMDLARVFLYAKIAEIYIFPVSLQSIKKDKVIHLELKTILFIVGLAGFAFLFFLDNGKMFDFYRWDLDFTFKKPMWN